MLNIKLSTNPHNFKIFLINLDTFILKFFMANSKLVNSFKLKFIELKRTLSFRWRGLISPSTVEPKCYRKVKKIVTR